jgi:hypothetical protein
LRRSPALGDDAANLDQDILFQFGEWPPHFGVRFGADPRDREAEALDDLAVQLAVDDLIRNPPDSRHLALPIASLSGPLPRPYSAGDGFGLAGTGFWRR